MLFQIRGQNTTALGPNLDTLLKTYRNRAAPLHSYIIRSHLSPVVAQMNTCDNLSMVAQRLKRLPAMQEPWVRSLGQEDLLEKEMATHSSILTWRIPWRGGAGGLQFTGLQRVGHD